jgi:hypothetical protein
VTHGSQLRFSALFSRPMRMLKRKSNKLRGCLTIEDGSKERLDCYDGVVPPDPKPKPPAAKVVADLNF